MEEKEEDQLTLTIGDFINDPSSINSENFSKLLELLDSNLEKGIHYFVPFLKLCPKLLKLYIEKDLDEKEEEKFYQILENLKECSFINREYLNPIYEYFSDILYNVKEIKQNDQKLLKFSKMQKLWKAFYNTDIEKIDVFSSSICFYGGHLNLIPKYDFNIKNNEFELISPITITIIFHPSSIQRELNYNYLNLITIKGYEGGKIEKEMYKNQKNVDISKDLSKELSLKVKMTKDSIKISLREEKIREIKPPKIIRKLSILENFYGEITKIKIHHNKDLIYSSSELQFKKTHTIKQKGGDKKIFDLEYIKCQKNYSNYTDEDFHLFEYFGGLKPLIPFVSLIKGIYTNNNVQKIGDIGKNEYLRNFIQDIFYVLNQYCKELNSKNMNSINDNYITFNENRKNEFKNNLLFFLYLLFQIDSKLIPQNIIYFENNKIKTYLSEGFNEINTFLKNYNLKYIIDLFIGIYNKEPNENETNDKDIGKEKEKAKHKKKIN